MAKGLIEYDINEIIDTVKTPEKILPIHPSNLEYSLMFHTPNEDYNVDNPTSMDILRDYNGNVIDYITLDITFPMGTFIYDIYPNRDHLEFTIVEFIENKPKSERFKAIVTNNNTGAETSVYSNMDKEELNKTTKVNITLQLIPLVYDALRTLTVSGVYNYSDVKTCMLSSFEISKSKFMINGADGKDIKMSIVEPNNNRQYRHIKIPPNVNVLDVPFYLQETDYGVYNANIGVYYQEFNNRVLKKNNKFIWVYPLYEYTRFDKEDVKAIIYGSHDKRYDNITTPNPRVRI